MRTQDSGENVWTERDDRASEEKSEAREFGSSYLSKEIYLYGIII